MPAPPHSLHQPALHGERLANVVGSCCFAARPANCWLFVSSRPVPGRSPAGCVRLQWLVLQAVCLLAFAMPCHAHCPQRSCPRSFCFVCPHLFIPCAPGSSQVCCKNCPVGSCNTGLQRRPVRRFHLTLTLFPAEFNDPGPWFSVNL